MTLACFAAGLFVCGLLLHLAWWHWRMPQRQTAALLGLFLAVLAVGLAAGPHLPVVAPWAPRGFWPCLQVSLFHIACTLAYIVTYSALEGRSPSMTLLLEVADAKEEGRTRDELLAALSWFSPIDSRLVAMERDGMIVADGEQYRILPKGRTWAAVLDVWRRVVGLGKGG
jgi:hypothetical protein